MIASAAIKYNSLICTGRNHAEIIFNLIKHTYYEGNGTVEGFINDKGQFLTRHEAAAHAYKCGQTKEWKPELFSYDLGWE
jgi:hypothetical protein